MENNCAETSAGNRIVSTKIDLVSYLTYSYRRASVVDLEPADSRIRRLPVRSHSKQRKSMPPQEDDFLQKHRGPGLDIVAEMDFTKDKITAFAVSSVSKSGVQTSIS